MNDPLKLTGPKPRTLFMVSLPFVTVLLLILSSFLRRPIGFDWLRAPALPVDFTQAIMAEVCGDAGAAARNYADLAGGSLHQQYFRGLAGENFRREALEKFATEDFLACEQLLVKARSFTEPDMFAILIEGIAQQRLGAIDSAIKLFEEARTKAPAVIDPLIALANLYLIERNLPEATRYYESAAAMAPTNPLPFINWGDGLSWLGLNREALELYRRALAIDERQPEAHLRIARILSEQEDSQDEVRRHLELVRRIRPEHPDLPPGNQPIIRRPHEQRMTSDRYLIHQQRVLFNLQRPEW